MKKKCHACNHECHCEDGRCKEYDGAFSDKDGQCKCECCDCEIPTYPDWG